MKVHQRMLARFCSQGDQIGTQSRPGRFIGDPGDDLVGLVVERVHDPGSDNLFGGDVQTVGVALHGLVEPDGGVTELPELGGGRGGCVVVGEDLFEEFGGGAGGDGVGG